MSPTLTFTPAMFHASMADLKNTTRRVIAKDCFRSADGRVKFLGVGTFAAPHLPSERKPMVTTWAVNESLDALKPSELNGHGFEIWFDDGSEKPTWAGKSRPGRFLPKSLYHLAPQVEILTVTPEFLLDITEASALQEGISQITKDSEGRNPPTWKYGLADRDKLPGTDDHGWPWDQWQLTARAAYCKLWDSINATRHGGLYASKNNPAVWVISYRLLPTTANNSQPQ